MKILYAIKDKYRGAEELVTWEGVPGTVAAWDNKYDAKSELPYLGDEAEVVPLLVLPTEPCDKCKSRWYGEFNYKDENSNDDWKTLMANEWKCCPNCGRSLE